MGCSNSHEETEDGFSSIGSKGGKQRPPRKGAERSRGERTASIGGGGSQRRKKSRTAMSSLVLEHEEEEATRLGGLSSIQTESSHMKMSGASSSRNDGSASVGSNKHRNIKDESDLHCSATQQQQQVLDTGGTTGSEGEQPRFLNLPSPPPPAPPTAFSPDNSTSAMESTDSKLMFESHHRTAQVSIGTFAADPADLSRSSGDFCNPMIAPSKRREEGVLLMQEGPPVIHASARRQTTAAAAAVASATDGGSHITDGGFGGLTIGTMQGGEQLMPAAAVPNGGSISHTSANPGMTPFVSFPLLTSALVDSATAVTTTTPTWKSQHPVPTHVPLKRSNLTKKAKDHVRGWMDEDWGFGAQADPQVDHHLQREEVVGDTTVSHFDSHYIEDPVIFTATVLRMQEEWAKEQQQQQFQADKSTFSITDVNHSIAPTQEDDLLLLSSTHSNQMFTSSTTTHTLTEYSVSCEGATTTIVHNGGHQRDFPPPNNNGVSPPTATYSAPAWIAKGTTIPFPSPTNPFGASSLTGGSYSSSFRATTTGSPAQAKNNANNPNNKNRKRSPSSSGISRYGFLVPKVLPLCGTTDTPTTTTLGREESPPPPPGLPLAGSTTNMGKATSHTSDDPAGMMVLSYYTPGKLILPFIDPAATEDQITVECVMAQHHDAKKQLQAAAALRSRYHGLQPRTREWFLQQQLGQQQQH